MRLVCLPVARLQRNCLWVASGRLCITLFSSDTTLCNCDTLFDGSVSMLGVNIGVSRCKVERELSSENYSVRISEMSKASVFC